MMDDLITLCQYAIVRDEHDQDILTLTQETQVWAKEEDLSNGFFFRSTAEGHRLVTSYLIHPFEYSGEPRIRAHDRLLKIERVRPVLKYGLDLLEIIVGELDGKEES